MITLLVTTTDNSAAQAGYGLFAIFVMFGIYMLPTLIALFRRKSEGGVSILLVNLLLGWTVVGWILCLVWANTGRTIRDIRREEQWHKQLLNAVNGKVNLLAAIVLAAWAITAQAYAMGLGVLRQQAHQRVDIEFAVTDFGAVCSGDTSPECKDKRNKIAANIKSYIAGIEANINFCKRNAENAAPNERPDIEKSIKDYEKDIQWSQSQLKAVAPLPTSAVPSKSTVGNVNESSTQAANITLASNSSTSSNAAETATTTLESAPPATPPPSAITWRQINAINNLRSEYTDLQKEEAWKQFKGQRVMWVGKVEGIDKGWLGGLHLQVKMNRDTFTFDLAIDLKKSEEAKAMSVHKGDIIRFSGILNTWGSLLPISLDDGEIISVGGK